MEEVKTVQISAEELAELRAIKAQRDAKAKKENEIQSYKSLVDQVVHESVVTAQGLSESMTQTKNAVIESFRTVIEMKNELFKGQKTLKDGRYSDMFTNSEGTERIILGYNTLDNYDDTYTAGVAMVQSYIESLASDDKSHQLADMVTALLRERSKAGQLRAQNVLRLEKMANDSKNETFIEGMRIIRDAYKPIKTKQFLKVMVKDAETNEWKTVSLNMTDC